MIDFHTHIGTSKSDQAHATAGEVCRTVLAKSLGITRAVIFPIDEARPGISYGRLNQEVARAVSRTNGLIGFCRLDPHFGNRAIREMERSFRSGLVGVKLHPRSDDFRPAMASGILARLHDAMRPLVLHTSSEPNCRPGEWRALLLRYRDFPVIFAHAGKDAYREAVRVAKSLPNVYLETSTLSYYRTRWIYEHAGPEKIVFGSDFPYSHPAVEMAKWNLIWNEQAKKKILCTNAMRILEPWL